MKRNDVGWALAMAAALVAVPQQASAVDDEPPEYRERSDYRDAYRRGYERGFAGDPARGDRKSLEVTYRCGEALKSASANEHRTIYLDCTS